MVRNLPAICRFGRYELLGRLAVGGMAEIYLARETSTVEGAGSRHLVIKRVLAHVADDETFRSMFFDEARLAMQLMHPSIVHLYEFGEEQGSWFLAMEWIDGVALGKLIRKAREHGGIPAAIAVKICAQVADALHYAHTLRDQTGAPLGIVHRDVSPQNVMVSYGGAVKLLDFGIAKASFQHTKTQDGQVKGKFAYMAPQQCLGEPIDGRADVFALGVVLYESLTGRPLYHRKTQYETMRAVIEDPVPTLRKYRPDLPSSLDAIVQRALQKRAEDRFATAGEMQIALERWLAVEQEVVPPPRVGTYLEELFGDAIQQGPTVDSTPFGQSFQVVSGRPDAISIPSPPPASLPPPADAPAILDLGMAQVVDAVPAEGAVSGEVFRQTRKGKGGLWVGLGVLLLLLIVGGGVAAWKLLPASTESAVTTAPASTESAVGTATPTPPTAPAAGAEAVAPAEGPAADATAERSGMITFRTEPPGATVRIGDRDVPGVTPTALGEFPVGEHTVELHLEDHVAWAGRVVLRPGEPETLEVTLRPLPLPVASRATSGSMRPSTPRTPRPEATEPAAGASTGRVSINTRPWSKVYVGERLLGTTPIGNVEVPPGAVRLRIVDRDGTEHERTVRVAAGADERVFFDLSGVR